jgi:hypothetical protein
VRTNIVQNFTGNEIVLHSSLKEKPNAILLEFLYGHPVVFITVNKNSRQHNKPQLKATLLWY